MVDRDILDGHVAAVRAAAQGEIDLGERHLWPTLVDLHAHLDNGHIVDRAANRPGDFRGALADMLDRLFRLAPKRGLDVDLHVDESGTPPRRRCPPWRAPRCATATRPRHLRPLQLAGAPGGGDLP